MAVPPPASNAGPDLEALAEEARMAQLRQEIEALNARRRELDALQQELDAMREPTAQQPRPAPVVVPAPVVPAQPAPSAAVPPPPDAPAPAPAPANNNGGTSGWLIAGLVAVALMALLAMGIGAFAVLTATSGDAPLKAEIDRITVVDRPMATGTVRCTGSGAELHNDGMGKMAGGVTFFGDDGTTYAYSVWDAGCNQQTGELTGNDGNPVKVSDCKVSTGAGRVQPDTSCRIGRINYGPFDSRM